MKRLSFLIASLSILTALLAGCTPAQVDQPQNEEENTQSGEKEEVDPSTLQKIKYTVPVSGNWVYEDRPTFTFSMENPNEVAMKAEFRIIIKKEKAGGSTVYTYEGESTEVPALGTKTYDVTVDKSLDPGFYAASCSVNKKGSVTFIFGIAPTQIVSAPDMQADFNTYWDNTLAELEALDMNPVLTEIPGHEGAARKVYLVEFNSLPDTPGGEPTVTRGYYCEPKDGEPHPVLMHFEGYDDLSSPQKMWCPYGGSSADFAEFYLSTRGQMINNRTAALRDDGIARDFANTYGDWFAFQFGQLDGYYYRGAFMDCVQAVRFMATRPTSDMNNVFAEGKSQGGALSYATAALSPYPLRAIAPGVAFLGDFPDYFKIVNWPGNVAKSSKGSMTDEEMYAFLSYFDTKNLATRIDCSIIANIGLQDNICPPHTNIAPFNNVANPDKQMHYYPKMGHEIPEGWEDLYKEFFRARVK